MRKRQLRFLPFVRSLGTAAVGGSTLTVDSFSLAPGDGAIEVPGLRILIDRNSTITKPTELAWWDWTVFLLQIAAEIEHALMVQYLYAAYSLRADNFTGANVPHDARLLVNNWRREILQIAREEMSHLASVQNLLRFVGGPLTFDREDFPFRTPLYPFNFHLEPLTKGALAKYVVAEMPDLHSPDAEIQEIIQRAQDENEGLPVNRVGQIYDALLDIFDDTQKLDDSDLHPETADTLQARKGDWRGTSALLVREVSRRRSQSATDQNSALWLLDQVARQGEGAATYPPAFGVQSHFDRFLEIYRQFPEDGTSQEPDWVPALPLVRDPNTLPQPSSDPEIERSRITHPQGRLWAQMSNTHYRRLLFDLSHFLHTPGPLTADGQLTPKGHLRDWTFVEMRGWPEEGNYSGLGKLSQRLQQYRVKDPAHDDGEGLIAALPFELPYTLALPDSPVQRWRVHRELIRESLTLNEAIRSTEPDDALLQELRLFDMEALAVVELALSQPKISAP